MGDEPGRAESGDHVPGEDDPRDRTQLVIIATSAVLSGPDSGRRAGLGTLTAPIPAKTVSLRVCGRRPDLPVVGTVPDSGAERCCCPVAE